MKRYTTYKDSGVKWIGEIPNHWETRKIRSLFKERREKVSDKDWPALSVSKDGILPQLETAVKTDNGDNRKKVCKGDFVVNSRSDRKGSCGFSDYDGSVSLINIVLKPVNVIGQFYHYLFRSNEYIEEFYQNGRGIVSDLWTTRYSEMRNISIPFPPLSEQRAIVSFLDTELGKIDTYMEKEQQLIDRLKELKQSVIARAVTRGINPNAKMKPSGINWIGDIPEHWEVKSLRNFIRIVSEKEHPEEQLLSVVREQGVIIRNIESKEENHNFVPDDLSGYKLVKEGQFVINKMKAWQGSYAVSNYRGIVSPAYYTCDLNIKNKEFFNEAIRSKAYVPFFSQYSKGIRVGQWDLSPISLKEIPFLLPPLSEQQQIVDYITTATTKIDKLIVEKTYELEYMKELRQRIISDAVTGKIDVR